MDSNTISFNTIISSTHSIISPNIIDQSKSITTKSSQESTTFIDYQQFAKASNKTNSSKHNDYESQTKDTHIISKTKIIQKQSHIKKSSQKHIQNQYPNHFNLSTNKIHNNQIHSQYVKNTTNNNSNINASKIQTKKPIVVKSHSFVSVFDWMMEIASIMKLTRTVYYRACTIFYETYKKDQSILKNFNVQKYTIACILISAKLQTANADYLSQLQHINKKRMTKQLITETQIAVYRALNWKIPLHNLISQHVTQVFTKWNQYLQKCQKMILIRKDTREKLSINLKYEQNQPLKNKTYGQILYLLDIMLLNQTKKYMSAVSIQSEQKPFITPIVIAMYSVFTIQLGDTQNKNKFFFPLIKNFYRQQLERSAIQIDRLGKQIQISFMIFEFSQHVSKIPLTKDWKQVIQKDLLTYLPINVLRKIENQ